MEEDLIDVDRLFGEQDGKGTAVNSSPEPGEQKARKGEQDQAALARSLTGIVKPLEQIDLKTGSRPPGGGPAGGGGGATPAKTETASDQVLAVGPGGTSGPLEDPAAGQTQVRPQLARAPQQVDPDRPQADRRTGPLAGGSPAENQGPTPIGIGPGNRLPPSRPPAPIALVPPGNGGAVPSLPEGPDVGPKPRELGREAQIALPRQPQPGIGQGGGEVPILRATTRPTSPQLAAAIGPADRPPGKKNPAPGPPGPGDGPGEGDPPSKSPVNDGSVSQSESDAFSVVQADMFVRGGVKAKAGRKVQTVKPRLGEHSLIDWATLGRVVQIFRVSINKDGRVTNVEVRRASGSDSLDLETSLAIYRWWIEPKKGPHGLPVADTILLTVVWH